MAAYAVIKRVPPGAVGGVAEVLLCRLAPRISRTELWTLPGGGLDHGEDPRDALVREIVEETGLDAVVGETARVYSAHLPRASRDGVLGCRWCGRLASDWRCPTCEGRRVRAVVVGARRTAEELGRAFPGVPVRTSGRDDVLATVGCIGKTKDDVEQLVAALDGPGSLFGAGAGAAGERAG